jgi:hypothetical protein
VDTSRDTALLAARERKHEFDPKGIWIILNDAD